MIIISLDKNNNESVSRFNEYEWEESYKNVKLHCTKSDFNIMAATVKEFKKIEIRFGNFTLILENRNGQIYGIDPRNAESVRLARIGATRGFIPLIPYDDQQFIKEQGGTYKFIYNLIKQFDLEG